jgi:hypothetical protein
MEHDEGTPTREFMDGLLKGTVVEGENGGGSPKNLVDMLDGLDPQTQALLAQTNALIASVSASAQTSSASDEIAAAEVGGHSWLQGLQPAAMTDPAVLLHGHPDFQDLDSAADASQWTETESDNLSSMVWDDVCLKCFEARLRPDVSKQTIRECCETIVMPKGLGMKDESSTIWRAQRLDKKAEILQVLLRLGVSEVKTRSLVVVFVRKKKAPSSEFARINTIVYELATDIKLGLMEGALTLSSLSVDAFQASFDDAEATEDIQLDGQYLMDLELLCKSEMTANLKSFAKPLEEYARSKECDCALMMSLLDATYARYGVAKPQPITRKSLSEYPLESEPAARRGASRVDGLPAGERVQALVREAWKSIAQRFGAEAEARIKRKNLQIIDRIDNVEELQEVYITTLRDSVAAATSKETVALQHIFGEDAGALLFSCSCIMNTRPGQFYVTSSHLCFHSKVFPFPDHKAKFTVASVDGVALAHSGLASSMTVTIHGRVRTACNFHFVADTERILLLVEQVRK